MQTSSTGESPTICFGQQPCGFFPKNFLVAKINTAIRLQKEIGGRIVFFYHDSDADYRETITIMKDKTTGAGVRLNFIQENKIQKKYSPLYLKRIPQDWQKKILKQLPRFVDKKLINIFTSINYKTVADFCLEMYKKIGLLDGIEVIRSSDKRFRQNTIDLAEEFYADVPYQGEIVRAKISKDEATLHEGGGKYTKLSLPDKITKEQKSAGRDKRFTWMQSVIHCTHYIWGAGEQSYIDKMSAPNVKFINREDVEDPNFAWLPR
ncbi:MAG: hypothetical protein COT92_02610 [Candidatus Doudnabacteria bacterium CG10_big_fil_rev_8_21_14_0_10_42_18]|uniref:Uncharacterized protein n=1 Tax=Candidatus Doudnabacteria bacterium CG10_big_fil_rev_8_21_14_0_10_42_18 TaxID=1974552 RepID=A0A2H0VAU3_9BACT|nr:MAG: hypothetical protein COT92_02610 [Candidatus Doudnabacteria bacterium CG10_big_fil_rev_8_21_14_0_10_42_18]